MDTKWHFLFMILASVFIFFLIIRIILSKSEYLRRQKTIFLLSLIVVVAGMAFGKYGKAYGLPWWIYYSIPMLVTILLPPKLLKLNSQKTIAYIALSFLSAPFIHIIFSFFLGWTEYMPFWKIPFIGNLAG